MKLRLSSRMFLRRMLVLLCRVVVGGTFIISGWAKAIDPWGFVLKLYDYAAVWGFEPPHEIIVTASIALACVEFCTGIMLLAGAFKRFAVLTAAAMMAVMLPLTLYIAIKNPVSDCGCFGDFWVISNWATFIKNIVLTAAVIYLFVYNRVFKGLFPVPIQWMVSTVSLAFPMFLAFVGYTIQPVVDFRPFKLGTAIFIPNIDSREEHPTQYIYERDGERRKFDLSSLPDSTWVFVGIDESKIPYDHQIAVYDEDGNNVAADFADDLQDHLFLIIAQPDLQFLTRARFMNELADYASRYDVAVSAVVGVDGDALDEWKELVRPRFEVFSAEDTSLKMLTRGSAGLVYTREGRIVWKRSLWSLDPAILYKKIEGNVLETVAPVDDGRLHRIAWLVYLASMLLIYLLGQSPRLLRLFTRSHADKEDKDKK